MIEIQFIDGTSESIEPLNGTSYEYDVDQQMFKVLNIDMRYVMFPREFVKSIRYIEV